MLPDLERLADEQCGVFSRTQAEAAGYDLPRIKQLLRDGAWQIITRGVYATTELVAAQADAPGGLYLLTCAARRLRVAGPSVVSHESAAVLYAIPLLEPVTGPVRLTLPAGSGSTRGRLAGRYVAELPPEHCSTIGGAPVTSAARTVVDLARTSAVEHAIVSAEGALRLGLDRAELLDVIAACRRWPGIEQAQQVAVLASRWSESALESLAMLWFRRQGLPLPEQQLTIRTASGRWLARVDFVWPERRTICEVDGQMKYVDAAPNATPAQLSRRAKALWLEKLREDRLRDTGLEVARGYWSDRDDEGAALADRVRRAFARGAAAAGSGTYRIVDERSHARLGPLAASPVR